MASLDLAGRFRAVFALDPIAPALQFEGSWRTWGQLAARVDAVDALLTGAGLGPGAPIGAVLANRPEGVVALVALLCTGRTVVTLSPIQPDAALSADIERLRLPAVIAGERDWGRAGVVVAARAGGSLGIVVSDGEVEPARPVPGLGSPGSGPHHETMPGVAIEMLTSGTTGPAKRVPITYRSMEASIEGTSHYQRGGTEQLSLKRGVGILWTPLVHIGGMWHVVAAVSEGRMISLMERFDVDGWVELAREHKPRIAGLPPTALRMVLDAKVPKEALSSLQAVRAGTAPLDPALAEEWERTYGMPVLTTYGATEFSGAVAGWTIRDHAEFGVSKRGSVGRAHPNIDLRVVDREAGQQVGPGEVGLLEVRGPQLPSDGWVRTTDLATLDKDGFLWITGRADDVIIRGGFKVPTTFVATTLASHPAVKEASVVGVPDPRLGSVPVAAVELEDGAERPTPQTLIAWLRERLTPYQVPVELKIIDALPRTPSMKVSQPGVRQLFEDR